MAHASVSSISSGILIAKQAFATKYSANVPSCGCLTFLDAPHTRQRVAIYAVDSRKYVRSIANSTNSVTYLQVFVHARTYVEDYTSVVQAWASASRIANPHEVNMFPVRGIHSHSSCLDQYETLSQFWRWRIDDGGMPTALDYNGLHRLWDSCGHFEQLCFWRSQTQLQNLNKSNSKKIVSIFRATQRVCWLCQFWRSCFQGLSRRKRSSPYEPRSAMRARPKVDFLNQRIKFRESRCESSSNTEGYRKSMLPRTSSDRERGTASLHYSLLRSASSLKPEIVLQVYLAVSRSRITSTSVLDAALLPISGIVFAHISQEGYQHSPVRNQILDRLLDSIP